MQDAAKMYFSRSSSHENKYEFVLLNFSTFYEWSPRTICTYHQLQLYMLDQPDLLDTTTPPTFIPLAFNLLAIHITIVVFPHSRCSSYNYDCHYS